MDTESSLTSLWETFGPPRWLVVSLVSTYALYKITTWNFGLFKGMGIRGPKPWPIVGTLMPLMDMGLTKHDLKMKREYGSLVGTFVGGKPTLLVYDLDMIKAIMVKEFSNFQNRWSIQIPDYPLSKMLAYLHDDQWKHVRNTLTPTFSSGKLRKMQKVIEQCTKTLLDNLRQKADANETLEFREYCGAYTMDVIASTSFGLQIDSHNDPKNPFVQMSNKLFDFTAGSLRGVVLLFFPFLLKPLGMLGYTQFPKDMTEFFVQTVEQALEQRKQDTSAETKVDFLQLMVNAEADHEDIDDEDSTPAKDTATEKRSDAWKSNRRGLTREEVLAQSIMFLLAGYDTTASTLSFLGYLLAVNNDCQDKLIAEIDSVMAGQDQVTFDVVNKMPYLDMCISETLRLYPPAPRADRVSSEEITINGVLIPKGFQLSVPTYAIQNDPEYWPNPERFDPDRFLPEAKEARNPYCYMPFGVGPRNCIGMRLALMEMKLALVHVLLKFRLVTCDETQIPLVLDKMRMKGTEGIKLRVKSRDTV